jgi:hypothetical protein
MIRLSSRAGSAAAPLSRHFINVTTRLRRGHYFRGARRHVPHPLRSLCGITPSSGPKHIVASISHFFLLKGPVIAASLVVLSEEFLRAFGLRTEHTGESFENLLKIHHLVRAHPDLALFVQASPAFCCPSLVTKAMTRDIERRIRASTPAVTRRTTCGSPRKCRGSLRKCCSVRA